MKNNSLLLKDIQKKAILMKTSPENILREEIQKCVLFLLSEMNFFQEGVFQGGTALRIIYGNVRYSEDLDFTFQSKNSSLYDDLETLATTIPNKLQKWFPYLHIHKGKWQKQSQTLKRYQFTSNVESLNATIMLQLEFANIPVYQPTLSTISWNMVTFPIKAESESEILADKIVAFGLRSYLKGRDLWDMYYLLYDKRVLLQNQNLISILKQKISDYQFSGLDYLEKATINLHLLQTNGVQILDHEMKRFMDYRLYSVYSNEFSKVIVLLSKNLQDTLDLLSHEY